MLSLPFLSDFIQALAMMQTGDGICKRKSCGPTSDGRPKRTRKTTKGDGFEQDTGASQRRIQEADTDNLSEDGGSTEFSPKLLVQQPGPCRALPPHSPPAQAHLHGRTTGRCPAQLIDEKKEEKKGSFKRMYIIVVVSGCKDLDPLKSTKI
jgi:hypothetical protein